MSIQNLVKRLNDGICENSWLYLTADYFCKRLNIIRFAGLWICLDKTKQNPGVVPFISNKILGLQSLQIHFQIQFYLHITNLLTCHETLTTNSK